VAAYLDSKLMGLLEPACWRQAGAWTAQEGVAVFIDMATAAEKMKLTLRQ
jgi:hypothetical protein